MPGRKTGRRVSCGNAGAVESVESQKQAYHPFHEPLGNPAKRRRDSHISTAPAARADGKVENQKQVSHFPTPARDDRPSTFSLPETPAPTTALHSPSGGPN